MFYIYADGKMIYNLANPELYLNQPKLTLEMGKAGSLEFGIMPDHAYYDRLSQLSTIVTVEYDDTEIFRGRVLSNTRDFQNMRQVYCEGDLAYLVDTVQKFSKYNGTVHDLFRKIIADHNTRIKDTSKQFTVGNITVENRSVKLTGQDDDEINVGNIDYKQIAINSIVDEWNTTFDIIQTCIIDYVGGYLNTRRQNGVSYIDLLTAPSNADSNTTNQAIELGVNMLDFEEEISAEDLFTVLIPLGDDNLTIKSVNNGSDELVDTNAVNKYGRIIKTHVFNNVNEASTLLENARRYLASNINIPTTLTIKALDMHIINKEYDAIHLCDKVHIRSTRHSIVEYLTCTKIEYDLENPANDTYTFGNPTQTLTQRYREDKRKDADTYGNGGGYGGGGGAAADAAEAAADAGEESVDDKLQSFYDSWIDLDPSDGNISLGAAYHRILKMKNVLTQWGIDAFADDTSSAVNINTLYQEQGIISGAVSQNATNISSLSDALGAEINLRASAISELNDSVAEISIKANANGNSIIALRSDVIELDGKVVANYAEFEDVISGRTTIGLLKANTIDTSVLEVDRSASIGSLAVSGTATLGGNNIMTNVHSHYIQAATDGTVTIGNAKTDGNGSFNIADTKFYKDGVSAAKTAGAQSATIRSLGINSVGSPYTYSGNRYEDVVIGWSVQATQGDGNLYTTSGTLTKAVNVDAAYQAGVDSFEAVTVYVLGSSTTKYDSGGSASGQDVGSSVDTTYLYHSWDGVNFSPWRPTSSVYYGGSSYSYNLRGSSGRYYNSGGAQTYYRKK